MGLLKLGQGLFKNRKAIASTTKEIVAQPTVQNLAQSKKTYSLAGNILLNKQLPPKQELRSQIGGALNYIRKNPIKAWQEGWKADKYAMDQYRGLTGKGRLQTGAMILGSAGQGAYGAGGKDILVNVGGLGGSIVGANMGGTVGALAGDYLGARVARQGLDTAQALGQTALSLSKDNVARRPLGTRMALARRRFLKYKSNIKDDFAGDTTGWAVGNSAAMGLNALGSHIPIQGGAVAMATVAPLIKGGQVASRTGNARLGVQSFGRNIKKRFNTKAHIRKVGRMEDRMIGGINDSFEKNLPATPSYMKFKKSLNHLVRL